LLQKYTLLTLPKRIPICQISLLLQSGHQLLPSAGGSATPSFEAGARAMVRIAIATSGTPQTARLQRQESSTSGRTTGIVSARQEPAKQVFGLFWRGRFLSEVRGRQKAQLRLKLDMRLEEPFLRGSMGQGNHGRIPHRAIRIFEEVE
jgi:hypothetical protein